METNAERIDPPLASLVWDDAQILNERGQLLIKRYLEGNLAGPEAYAQLAELIAAADPTVVRLAARLLTEWLLVLIDRPRP